MLFHAGTKRAGDTILSNGGRLLAITSLADNHADACAKSIANAEKIKYNGKYFRRDIGFDL